MKPEAAQSCLEFHAGDVPIPEEKWKAINAMMYSFFSKLEDDFQIFKAIALEFRERYFVWLAELKKCEENVKTIADDVAAHARKIAPVHLTGTTLIALSGFSFVSGFVCSALSQEISYPLKVAGMLGCSAGAVIKSWAQYRGASFKDKALKEVASFIQCDKQETEILSSLVAKCKSQTRRTLFSIMSKDFFKHISEDYYSCFDEDVQKSLKDIENGVSNGNDYYAVVKFWVDNIFPHFKSFPIGLDVKSLLRFGEVILSGVAYRCCVDVSHAMNLSEVPSQDSVQYSDNALVGINVIQNSLEVLDLLNKRNCTDGLVLKLERLMDQMQEKKNKITDFYNKVINVMQ